MFLQRYPIYSITCSSHWHRLAGNAETKQKRFFFSFTTSKHKGPRVWVAVRKHGTLFTTGIMKYCCVRHKQKFSFEFILQKLHQSCIFDVYIATFFGRKHELFICFFLAMIEMIELMVHY